VTQKSDQFSTRVLKGMVNRGNAAMKKYYFSSLSALSFVRGLVPGRVKHFLISLAFQVRRPFLLSQALHVGSRLNAQHSHRKTVLFFAPEAGVAPYLMAQAIIGKTLQEKGHNVLFVRCFDLMQRCPVKVGNYLPYDATPEQSLDACVKCWGYSDSILSQYQLDYIDIREVIDDQAKERIALAMKNLPDNRVEYCYENIPVGRLAFYDFSITNKHPAHQPIASKEHYIFDQYLETVIMSVEMMKAIVLHHKIDTLASFDAYGMMSAARLFALDRNIFPLMVSIAYHLNGDWRRVAGLSNLSMVKEQAWRLEQWPNWRELSLPKAMVGEVMDDLILRLTGSGSHIYSPNKTLTTDSIFKNLGLSVHRKTLVAFTSSTDERDAMLYSLHSLGYQDLHSRGAFGDSFEWLNALIEYVETSDDLQLVVRLHPRIGATARDNISAKEYIRYREEFSGSYAHTKFIWPEEKISSYDIAEFADIALISWSSMGLELARLGVPVLSGYPSIFSLAPDDGFIVTALERNEYFDSLRRLLGCATPTHAAHMVRLSFRWYHMAYLGNTIDLSDVVSDRTMQKLPPFKLSKNADVIEEVFVNHKAAINFNLTQLVETQTRESFADESYALAGQLGRMIVFFCTGIDRPGYANIKIVDRIIPGIRMQQELVIEGNTVEYGDDAGVYRRYSPLVARLAMVYHCLTVDK
jgi:hypothetical protein